METTKTFDPTTKLWTITQDVVGACPGRVQTTTSLDEEGKVLHSMNDEPSLTIASWSGKVVEQKWYRFGLLHRDNDKPATIDSNVKVWMMYGVCTRGGDRPAVVFEDGEEQYIVNGQMHRFDDPAVIRPDGSREWFINGSRCHYNGDATIITNDGTKLWTLGNPTHEIEDKLHNEHGPAVIHPDGSVEYWLGGSRVPVELFNEITKVL